MSRQIRPDAVLVQAVIAGALSFAHLHDLAAAAGQTGWKAWAYPVSVDLLLVAAWRRLRSDGPSRLAWCWFLVALVASLGANVATAGFLDMEHPPALLRLGVAGWPALAFLGGTLLAHSPTPRPATDDHDHAADVPEPATVARAPESVAEHEPIPAAEPAPALPEAPPAPAVQPPPALVAHARRLADDHQARTGSPIDLETLRARLNVPSAMADAVAAQLA
ncbi:DUF2637 domain-containing protein [Streptomyces chartreusis]|uniref:DUF2637 domain-containing protein n=1 Tax=Streptomyces chartreusis TaxID=1969 RepID=UPI002E8063A6|nr:DUF2637 domain-containing protein [Streptomyces chartreusis]WUB20668.1 DUF2637 domain-containing protein [Streptomyces chartreusis]